MSSLQVRNLSVSFETRRGRLLALDQVSFSLEKGESLGLVGESGCGKSITSLAIMGLLPPNGRVEGGEITYDSKVLVSRSSLESSHDGIRGKRIGMIFQDPLTSLNPSFTVGAQIEESLNFHLGLQGEALRTEAIRLLKLVGIPAPLERLAAYPHQLSGGMSQRVMIAMVLAPRPELLIADEPTTALDVTIQAQILELLHRLRRDLQMSLILITHDLGVVSEMTERLAVMYAGQIVETGLTRDLLDAPQHPYTHGLLASLPARTKGAAGKRARLPSLGGMVPDLNFRPSGCQLHPRCPYVKEDCKTKAPELFSIGPRQVRCFHPVGGQSS
jgi:oligopeptide/dipeptide ABC transporter ATP-binding protein